MTHKQHLRYKTPAYVRTEGTRNKSDPPQSGFYEIYSFLTGRPLGSIQLRGYAKQPTPVVAEHASSTRWKVIRLKNGRYVLEIDGKPTTEVDNFAAVLPNKADNDYEEWILQPESFFAGEGEDGTFLIKNEDATRWWSIDPILRGPVKCFPINHKPGPTPSERLFVFKPVGDVRMGQQQAPPPRTEEEEDEEEEEDFDDETESGSETEAGSESDPKPQ